MCTGVCVQATNRSGVEWLRRHVKPRGISVHSLLFKGLHNCHADATFIPLSESHLHCATCTKFYLLACFDAVDWASGRASGMYN